MKKIRILIILTAFTILVSYGLGISGQEKSLNLLGIEICPNSAGSLLRDEISGMTKEDTLNVIIETDRKEIVQTAIKLEKLPVIYEEQEDKDRTIFIIKLKQEEK